MRAVIQRVSDAEVTVAGRVVGRIGPGLLVYVGVAKGDGPEDVDRLAKKIRYLRIFRDEAGKTNLDVSQTGGSVLVVSNFTLQANVHRGRRPDFTGAAPPERAEELYEQLCEELRGLGLHVEMGSFGEMMSVTSANNGPINILVDSKQAS